MPSPSVALLRTQSDDRLVALAAGGHERAFEAIVERYRRPLLRHARRYLPEARAEDALQQALLSAWTALRRGDEVRELRPWLHRIVHNTALNALRASGYDYDELRETLEGSGGPAELAERRAVVRGTLAGLAALPERQRDALLQIAVEGRSQDEVAAELGLTQNAVRQLVHRARTSAARRRDRRDAAAARDLARDRRRRTRRLRRARRRARRRRRRRARRSPRPAPSRCSRAERSPARRWCTTRATRAQSARSRGGKRARRRRSRRPDTPRDEPVRIAAPAPTAAGGGQRGRRRRPIRTAG